MQMMKKNVCKCVNQKIMMPSVGFDMPITDLVLELEKLRYKILEGTTHPLVFMQMKSIFHMLESIGSSRIEGNNTTIMDYVESTKINDGSFIGMSRSRRF